MKKAAIVIATLLIFTGGTFVALKQGDTIPPQAIVDLDFSPIDFAFTTSNAEYATTDDEQGNEIRTGIKIPIKFDFPVATTSGYIIQEIEENVEMNFDGYNMCRSNGKTKTVCLAELDDDIVQTVEAFKENKARELKELQRQSFQDEIIL